MPESPVTVAVISDSHISKIEDLHPKVLETLSRVDAIIHLGDFTSPELLNELRKYPNFCGVIGNHDGLIGRRKLNVLEVIELGGKRLGLIHGVFLPLARPKRLLAWFRKYNVDVLLCGHSHLCSAKTVDGILMFNPGTVTGQFPATHASFGLLTLDGTIKSEIVSLAPGKKSFWWQALAFFIRHGIRFLEAWPYIDIYRLKNRFKQSRKKRASSEYYSRTDQESSIN